MKPALAALWIASLGAAFWLGRLGAPDGAPSDALPATRGMEEFGAALRERDALERTYELSSFLRNVQPGELPAILELVEAHHLGMRPDDVRLFMHAWTRFDAPGALAWARSWPTPWTETLTREACYAWGFRDGPGALRALEALEDDELERRLRPSVLEGWLHSDDRARAGEYIASRSDPRVRRRLTFTLASEVAKDGVDAVILWAEAVPVDAPNGFKQGSFYNAASVIARSDPQRAASWYEQNRTQPFSEGSLDVIARKWARFHDASALFDWLQSLPDDEARPGERGRAIGDGFRSWTQRDTDEAESWLAAALPDPNLDPAVKELVGALLPTSPASAAAWAQRIEDEKLRKKTLSLVGRSWRVRDPDAVKAWLAASDLPESLQHAILSGPQSPRPRRAVAAPAEPESR